MIVGRRLEGFPGRSRTSPAGSSRRRRSRRCRISRRRSWARKSSRSLFWPGSRRNGGRDPPACQQHLAIVQSARPVIEFVDELPRNPAGKVLKKELAQFRIERAGCGRSDIAAFLQAQHVDQICAPPVQTVASDRTPPIALAASAWLICNSEVRQLVRTGNDARRGCAVCCRCGLDSLMIVELRDRLQAQVGPSSWNCRPRWSSIIRGSAIWRISRCSQLAPDPTTVGVGTSSHSRRDSQTMRKQAAAASESNTCRRRCPKSKRMRRADPRTERVRLMSSARRTISTSLSPPSRRC